MLQVDGDWRYDSRRGALLWSITLIDDTNRSGSLEFVVPATEPEAFYPIDVSFSSSTTLADVAVDAVLPTGGEGPPVKYGSRRGLSAAHYQVV
jgi:coatomer subunit delta